MYNDEDNRYRNLKTEDTISDAMYVMKANIALNTEMYAYAQSEINSGRVHFLVDEQVAKNKLLAQSQGKKMSASQRAEYLAPYVKTSALREQMMNLIQENEGVNIILKQSSKKIPKDKFSALIYALYYCKLQEDRTNRRRSNGLANYIFYD